MTSRRSKQNPEARPQPAPAAAPEPAALAPVAEVVRLAQAFLEDAEAGRIRAAALALVQADGRSNSKSAAPENDIVAVHLLNSSIATLLYAFQRALTGGN